MKIVVLDGHTLNPGDLDWQPLRALGECVIYPRSTTAETIERAAGAEAIITNKALVTAEIIQQLPALRYIGVTATGYNVVDVPAAAQAGVTVTNVPAYGTASVAQHAIALLLELSNHVGLHSRAVAAGEWSACEDWCFTKAPIAELDGLAFGVIGWGRIGRATAQIARAFGMKILACTRTPRSEPEVEFTDLETLLSTADVVSLHCPLTPRTDRLINAARLAFMKPSALLINTSRGQLIDEAALAEALNAGHLAGAALDVLSSEPPARTIPCSAPATASSPRTMPGLPARPAAGCSTPAFKTSAPSSTAARSTSFPDLPHTVPIPEELARILEQTPELSRACLVGGCVRDACLGLPVKDYDVECHGVSYEALSRALSRWGRTDLVGRSFGVIKLTTGSGLDYDFSIPRRDSKSGIGHKGFEVQFDPDITPREAAERRDFTINSLIYDPREKRVIDYFGGLEDLEMRILRHTSAAFVEDPLRVLRGMQFAGRFDLTARPETIELCAGICDSFSELPVERVREEWFKWAAKSVRPSAGIIFLEATGWLAHFPEIAALRQTPQDPQWHPEGDVLAHTCHCLDALAQLPGWQQADPATRIALSFGVLAHDFGKPATTRAEFKNGRDCIVSPGHDSAGVPITEQFLDRIGAPNELRRRVPPLVLCHLAHLQEITPRAIRRLARRLHPATIEELCLVIQADHSGRPPHPPSIPEGVHRLIEGARELRLEAEAPRPILLGRHLIERGMKPGPEFGPILKAAFEAQLDGAFDDLPGALAWLDRHVGD